MAVDPTSSANSSKDRSLWRWTLLAQPIRLIKICSFLLARPRSMPKSGRVAFSRGSGCFPKKPSSFIKIPTQSNMLNPHSNNVHIFYR